MNPNQKLLAAQFTLEGPGITPGATPIDTLDKIISFVIGFLSIILIIWLTIQTILAAYKYISANGDKGKVEEARKALTNGVLGVAIGLMAIFLVAFLAKLLGADDPFNLPAQIGRIVTF